MNELVVIQATQGLCAYVESQIENVKERGVCVGYDGRHNSIDFALLTAATFLHKDIPVYLFNTTVPTPFVAFCVKHLNLCAGVMVTASHNPKQDNGYKVYWDSGSQIVAPHDAGIKKCISENLEPWGVTKDIKSHALLHDPTNDISKAYYENILSLCSFATKEENSKSPIKIVYTPMHGVGQPWIDQAFEACGLPKCIDVPQQREPDPEFSTVPFPNPEEGKGALKLAIEQAEANNTTFVIANDPDADRFAAAEKQPNGEWRIFTGNELGIIFAYWTWYNIKKSTPNIDPSNWFVINTTVSSKMLKAMADKEGLYYEETLTGFKWMGTLAQQLIAKGKNLVMSFEESIGYMIRDTCLDKDGVRAAIMWAELLHHIHSNNNDNINTITDFLNSLYEKYGYFACYNKYFFCYDKAIMKRIFDKITSNYPTTCGEFKVKYVRDLTADYDSAQSDNKPVLPPSSFMITFTFENGAILTVRGSGTEPKLKYYADICGDYSKKEEVDATLDKLLKAAIAELLEPEKNGLIAPE